jgi:hypothetical protein
MKRRVLLGHLQAQGCVPLREGGSHSIGATRRLAARKPFPGTTKSRNIWHVPSAATFPWQFRRAIKTSNGIPADLKATQRVGARRLIEGQMPGRSPSPPRRGSWGEGEKSRCH